jgi:DNA polymerase-3 subunit epsilon
MKKIKRLFLDTETTGLDYNRHGIIQIGAVIRIGDEVINEINLRCRPFPYQKISKEALEINKKTVEEIMEYPDPVDTYREFVSFLDAYVNRYDKTDKLFLVGYNAFFDNMFVRKFFENNNEMYYSSYFWWPPVDVAVLLQEVVMENRHKFENFTLENIAKLMGIECDIHDALSDAKTCMLVYDAIEEFRNK